MDMCMNLGTYMGVNVTRVQSHIHAQVDVPNHTHTSNIHTEIPLEFSVQMQPVSGYIFAQELYGAHTAKTCGYHSG